MDFLDKLYSSNYFGIGLFAVIAFLVVTFLIVLFFGKKDEKKRKLEATQKLETENTFKETGAATPVEIPVNPEPVAPINLEPTDVTINTPVEPISTIPVEPVTPVMPVPPVEPATRDDSNEYIDNLTVEEPTVTPVTPIITETPQVDNFTPVTPIITEDSKVEVMPKRIELEPTKIEIPQETVKPIINNEIPIPVTEPVRPVIEERVTPIIKEEEPKLEINEEPVINSYYKPVEKNDTEPIKVPNIDFDALAKSISKELDELENDSKKYDEVKVTPISEVTKREEPERKRETFSSVYVREPKEVPAEKIELPKRIDLPARKSE